MLLASALALRRAARAAPCRALHASAAAAAASGAAAPARDGLPKKYCNLDELEADAKPLLTPQAYGYYASGSDDEWTLRENREALRRFRLVGRVAGWCWWVCWWVPALVLQGFSTTVGQQRVDWQAAVNMPCSQTRTLLSTSCRPCADASLAAAAHAGGCEQLGHQHHPAG